MAINSLPDPYKALGLASDASPAAIRSAYKKLMLQCHPDKVHDKSLQAEKAQQYQKVQEAYELLSDPRRKHKYDTEVQAAAEVRPSETRSSSKEERPREKTSSRERPPRQERSSSRREYDDYKPRETREPREPREAPPPRERRESTRESTRESPIKEPRERRESRTSREPEGRIPTESREPKESRDTAFREEGSRDREKRRESDADTASQAPLPSPTAYQLHQMKYEEEKRKENAKLDAARQKMAAQLGLGGDFKSTAPLGGGSTAPPREDPMEKARRKAEKEELRAREREAREKENRDRERARESVRMSTLPEEERKRTEDASKHGRRNSEKERDRSGSPNDTTPTSRERKSSHGPSVRKTSTSPSRSPLDTPSTSSRPIRTPYGSAPPPAASSTFGTFTGTSPRRRHSVSSPDPAKARLYRPEDSGYSSPVPPGTPMVDIPSPIVRSATEGSERGPGWKKYTFEVFVPEEIDPAQSRRRKTTSHHPAESVLGVSPPLGGEYHPRPAPLSSSVGSNSYYGYSPSTAPLDPRYYPSPTHAPPHFSHMSSAHSVHPASPSSARHPSRHHSHHHSTSSPAHSPKIGGDGFGTSPIRSTPTSAGPAPMSASHSGHSHSHSGSHNHYARSEVPYFTPPVLPRGHTL